MSYIKNTNTKIHGGQKIVCVCRNSIRFDVSKKKVITLFVTSYNENHEIWLELGVENAHYCMVYTGYHINMI